MTRPQIEMRPVFRLSIQAGSPALTAEGGVRPGVLRLVLAAEQHFLVARFNGLGSLSWETR